MRNPLTADRPLSLLENIGHQLGVLVTKDIVAGKFGLIDGNQLLARGHVMDALDGHASRLKKGRYEEGRHDTLQSLLGKHLADRIALGREVTAQGRVAAAYKEQVVATLTVCGQDRLDRFAYDLSGLRLGQGATID